MARYFNRTSGSLAVTLNGGGSVYIPSKCWMHIAPEQESSADLVRSLQQGYLARFEDLSTTMPYDTGAPVKASEDPATAGEQTPENLSQEGMTHG